MWQQPCAHYFSKTCTLSLRFRHFFSAMTQVLSRRTSSPTSDLPHYFELIRPYFYWIFTFPLIPTKTNLFRLATQNTLKTNQNVQTLSITLPDMHKEPSFNVKPTKIQSVFGGRGLPAWSTFTYGCKHSFYLSLSQYLPLLYIPYFSFLLFTLTTCLSSSSNHIIASSVLFLNLFHSQPPYLMKG